ncbi:DNA double-strand break repair protein Mre11 [Halalkaliarchaeum sp. AArc-GB]|uniref:DNA double-strand break repair protein Mre11 n=1 Tax=Halalkaliarchaeum sp. AArc-GB TaxID=3074078 RepID=UPI0028628411|nr:DNA double-strand break repair protein Mre11 [Halalkaliarchaeum sp. AArc-GB]MDR5672587.1 DNA double-strand break repair protein Mre11 [Halalkaliarchaeum sp. AArc-GB]
MTSADGSEPAPAPTRVLHTGDTHVGYEQYHSPERRRDFLEAFEQVVDDAIEESVDAVVHAGDLFHDRRPSLPDLLGTLELLRRLDAADIPFLAVVGNHESTRRGQWLDLFESMDLATRLGAEPVEVGETAFYGLDHVPESRRDDLDYEFEPSDAAHAALVSHGLFTPFAHANWDTETVLAESTVAFDAMLLGDNHVPDTATVDGTRVTYCGSTERTSASEETPRGYNLVTFDADTRGPDGVEIRRRTIETRPFAFVEVELADGEGVERVRERVTQHDLEDAVVIVRIDGSGDPVTPASIEETALEEGALIVRVTDRREVDTAEEISVSFGDPDEAVRERIREEGFSSAAREFDDVVRSVEIPASNVRAEVKNRLSDRIESEGLEALSATEPDDTSDGEEGSGDGKTDRESSNMGRVGEDRDMDGDGGDRDMGGDGEARGDEPKSSGPDGQRSMEEYL